MKNILCFGDSNTYGYMPLTGRRYDEKTRWTGRLQRLLGSDYKVIEEGCNGRTTVFEDPYDGWTKGIDYICPCIKSHKPIDIVILMLGSNDLKEFFHNTVDEIARGAGAIVDSIFSYCKEVQENQPRVILVSPPQIGENIARSDFYGTFTESAIERSKEFPAAYKRIAEEKGCIFFDAAQWIKASREDSLHLTPEGHAILASKFAELVLKLDGKALPSGGGYYVAHGSRITGDVTIANDCGIWYNAVIRGDEAPIIIGERTNIQDNSVLHTDYDFPLKIGSDVTIGHGAIVHGCTIGNNVMIGMGAIVMNGAVVGDNSIVGAGALVTQNTVIPEGSIAFGSPAKVKSKVTEDDIVHILYNADTYVKLAKKDLYKI